MSWDAAFDDFETYQILLKEFVYFLDLRLNYLFPDYNNPKHHQHQHYSRHSEHSLHQLHSS